jgi:hypothetical protein
VIERVELRCASIPLLGWLAEHYWFVVFDESGACRRWEVWQTADAGGTSFGHLHCDLKHPDANVGGGPTRLVAAWSGEDAVRISRVIDSFKTQYAYRDRYLPWPGPNSNTFVAWVLREAGVAFKLPRKAIGKAFR